MAGPTTMRVYRKLGFTCMITLQFRDSVVYLNSFVKQTSNKETQKECDPHLINSSKGGSGEIKTITR